MQPARTGWRKTPGEFAMKKEKLNKLVLNQETLSNLIQDQLRTVAGGRNTGIVPTCPECPSPPQSLNNPC